MKIGKSATEILERLTMAYSEEAMKKLSAFEWHRGEKMHMMAQEVGSQKHKKS